jgi:hypothetical protein
MRATFAGIFSPVKSKKLNQKLEWLHPELFLPFYATYCFQEQIATFHFGIWVICGLLFIQNTSCISIAHCLLSFAAS